MKKVLAWIILITFMLPLMPVEALAALPPESKVERIELVDEYGRPNTVAGQVHSLYVQFASTSIKEKITIELDSRINLLPLSMQPDKDKIEKIVGNTITLKPGIEDKKITIKFLKPLTTASEYKLYIKVGRANINGTGVNKVVVDPDVAVIVGDVDNDKKQRSTFDNELSLPKRDYDVAGNITKISYEGKINLQLRDKYNNPTNKIDPTKELRMRFQPIEDAKISDYKITMMSPSKFVDGREITTSFKNIDDSSIPTDKHNIGKITFIVKYATTEVLNDSPEVPKIQAALAPKGSVAIDYDKMITTNIGFIPKTQGATEEDSEQSLISVNGDVVIGSNSNEIQILVNRIYPAAGKQLVLTLPSGFQTMGSKSNKVYFDYDDIGKYKSVPLAAIPKKAKTFTKSDFKLDITPKDKNENLAYIDIESTIRMISGVASSAKSASKLVLDTKKKTAIANEVDMVLGQIELKDVTGNMTDLLADDMKLYIWAEREPGKVSKVDQIVSVPDGPKIEHSLEVEDNNTGRDHVYRVDVPLPEDGIIPFGVVSSEDKSTTIKAAFAPDAITATLAKNSDDGLLANTIKGTFTPFAATDTWLFKDVKVSGISESELRKNGANKYVAIKTKKSNGVDKFGVTATLDSLKGGVKLANEPILITPSSKELQITSKAKGAISNRDGSMEIPTGSSGKISFDLTSYSNGTYYVDVQAKNAKAGAGYFRLTVSFDETGGNIVDGDSGNDDIENAIKRVSKVVLVEQSSFMLAPGDDLYALFKLYDKENNQISIDSNSDARKVVRGLKFTAKPTDSDLEDGLNNDIDVEALDGGICVSFSPDELGKYDVTMTLSNGKSGKASFTVTQRDKLVKMELLYGETGLAINGVSSAPKVVFYDNKGNRYEQMLPLNGIRLSANGSAIEQFDRKTGIVKVKKGDNYSGSVVKVTATDSTHRLQATHEFVIGHDTLNLAFSNTTGLVHQILTVNAQIVDPQNRQLPSGALDPKKGAQIKIDVLSKPDKANVQVELINGGRELEQRSATTIKVKSDRIGKVKLRIDLKAIDPYYSSKYPVYTYLTGIVELEFNYPGILDSQPFPSGHEPSRSTLMYIGSKTYLSKGKEQSMDVAPFIQNGRTFIPVRALGDSLGAITGFNEQTDEITITLNDDVVKMTIGSPMIYSSKKGTITSDVVPFTRNNRTFLPLRATAEVFNCKVDPIVDVDGQTVGVVFSK